MNRLVQNKHIESSKALLAQNPEKEKKKKKTEIELAYVLKFR